MGFVPTMAQTGFTPKSTKTNRTRVSKFKTEGRNPVRYFLGGVHLPVSLWCDVLGLVRGPAVVEGVVGDKDGLRS